MPAHKRVDLNELAASIDLQEVLGTDKLFCPWHKDTTQPNLHVYADHLYCFAGCGSHNYAEYLMKTEGLRFGEAVTRMQQLVQDTGGFIAAASRRKAKPKVASVDMQLVEHMHLQLMALLDDTDVGEYIMQTRGISREVIRRCKLGWNGNSYAFPHFSGGKCTSVKFRVHPNYAVWYDSEGVAHERNRYTGLPGGHFAALYPNDFYLQEHFEATVTAIVEGELDALFLLSHGLPALSLPSGVSVPLYQYAAFLKQYKYILIAIDQDAPGRAAWQRMKTEKDALGQTEVAMLAPSKVLRVTWNEALGKDVSDAGDVVVDALREMVETLER
jgi:DNA primase